MAPSRRASMAIGKISALFGPGPIGPDSPLTTLRWRFVRQIRRSLLTLGRFQHFLLRQPIYLFVCPFQERYQPWVFHPASGIQNDLKHARDCGQWRQVEHERHTGKKRMKRDSVVNLQPIHLYRAIP
jgi:hypothetical protein